MTEEDLLEPRGILLEFIRKKGECTIRELIELDKSRQLGFRGRLASVLKEEGARGHIVVDFLQGTVTHVPS